MDPVRPRQRARLWKCLFEGEGCRVSEGLGSRVHRGTLLIRNTPLLRPYSRTIPRVLWWS